MFADLDIVFFGGTLLGNAYVKWVNTDVSLLALVYPFVRNLLCSRSIPRMACSLKNASTLLIHL